MNWDMMTAIAAIIGSIAIVVFFLYVALKMREIMRQWRFEKHHSLLAEVDELSKLIAHDQANADIWWRASKGVEKLTDAERVRYFAMLFILFRSWEKAFRYQAEGEAEDWSTDVITKPMVDFAMSNGVQEYWALRKRWYALDFRDWVDKKIKEHGGVDLYGEEFRIFGSADARSSS
jgi:hypothetical protein